VAARARWTWWAPVALFTIGLAVSSLVLLWSWLSAPVSHPGWFVQNDLIRSIQNAWWQGRHSGLLRLYSGDGATLVGLPGFQMLLVAIVLLGQHVGLSAPGEGAPLHAAVLGSGVHPVGSIWYLVVPLALAAAFAALFPFDALVRRCQLTGPRRVAVLSAVTVLIAWSAAYWGHPEYAVASGFLAGAVVRAQDRRWGSAGWLLGFGVACQPVVLLAVPLVLVLAQRRWVTTLVRTCIPPLVAVALPLVGDPRDTLHAVLVQSESWRIDPHHRTPLLALVPHPNRVMVNPGWPRDVALGLAVVLAFPLARWVRRRADVRALTWAVAVVLALRCTSESLVYPYYVFPFLIFSLPSVSGGRWFRAVGVLGYAAALVTLVSADVFGSWAYWSVLIVGQAGLLAIAFPGSTSGEEAPGAWRSAASPADRQDPGQLASAPTT